MLPFLTLTSLEQQKTQGEEKKQKELDEREQIKSVLDAQECREQLQKRMTEVLVSFFLKEKKRDEALAVYQHPLHPTTAQADSLVADLEKWLETHVSFPVQDKTESVHVCATSSAWYVVTPRELEVTEKLVLEPNRPEKTVVELTPWLPDRWKISIKNVIDLKMGHCQISIRSDRQQLGAPMILPVSEWRYVAEGPTTVASLSTYLKHRSWTFEKDSPALHPSDVLVGDWDQYIFLHDKRLTYVCGDSVRDVDVNRFSFKHGRSLLNSDLFETVARLEPWTRDVFLPWIRVSVEGAKLQADGQRILFQDEQDRWCVCASSMHSSDPIQEVTTAKDIGFDMSLDSLSETMSSKTSAHLSLDGVLFLRLYCCKKNGSEKSETSESDEDKKVVQGQAVLWTQQEGKWKQGKKWSLRLASQYCDNVKVDVLWWRDYLLFCPSYNGESTTIYHLESGQCRTVTHETEFCFKLSSKEDSLLSWDNSSAKWWRKETNSPSNFASLSYSAVQLLFKFGPQPQEKE